MSDKRSSGVIGSIFEAVIGPLTASAEAGAQILQDATGGRSSDKDEKK